MNRTEFRNWLQSAGRKPLVMGILNVTPDSFSDGGEYAAPDSAIGHAREMISAGADLIDIGGESTRPGAQRISADEQIHRVVPVIQQIRRESDIAVSIDTTLSRVAEAAVNAGADILNDISAGREDARVFDLAAKSDLPLVLMHMQGEPGTMQANPAYRDVTAEVSQFLRDRAEAAIGAGVPQGNILLDPGIGFGKTLEHNLRLLKDLPRLAELGFPLLVGTSRKRFIGTITGVETPSGRVIGSVVSAIFAVSRGASIVRVHDVSQTLMGMKLWSAMQNG